MTGAHHDARVIDDPSTLIHYPPPRFIKRHRNALLLPRARKTLRPIANTLNHEACACRGAFARGTGDDGRARCGVR